MVGLGFNSTSDGIESDWLIQRMVWAGRQFFRKKHPTSLHGRRFFLFIGFMVFGLWFWVLGLVLGLVLGMVLGMVLGYGGEVTG